MYHSSTYRIHVNNSHIVFSRAVLLLSSRFLNKRCGYCERLRPSVRPSRYLLLNHLAEFYQTFYITSPYYMYKGVREQHYFQSVRAAICPSRYLLLNHWGNSTKLAMSISLMVGVCKSIIILPCVRPSVRPSSVHLSITLSPPKQQGEFNQTCYICTSLSFMVRVFESNIIFPCVQPFVRPSSVHLPPSYLLLNHWAKFRQTCSITSPHCKNVREQHDFSMHPSIRAAVIRLSIPKPLGGI